MGRSKAGARPFVIRYTVVIERKASRALLALDPQQRARIAGAIELLSTNPYPPAARKLRNRPAYRVRVGDYRIIYTVNENTITIVVIAIGQRRDIYQ